MQAYRCHSYQLINVIACSEVTVQAVHKVEFFKDSEKFIRFSNADLWQSFLKIGSAHNKWAHRSKHCPNFAFVEVLLNRNTSLHLFTTKVKQNCNVKYSDRKSYFTNIAVQNVNKEFV